MLIDGQRGGGRRAWPRLRSTSRQAPIKAHGDAGFSILEVAIALAILMTALVSVSSLLATTFKVGANSRYKQEATAIASSTLDDQMSNGVTTLLTQEGDTSLPSVTSSGQVYLLEMEVAAFDPGNLGCVSPTTDPGAMLKVTVWATWTNQSAGSTWWISGSSSSTSLLAEETSLVAVPVSAIDPTKGSILVSIEGATTNPISNVTVTATPSSGSPQTVVTSAGGCALFANVSASVTWTVSFGTNTGYMTEQNLTSIPTTQPLSITADATTTVSFAPTSSPVPNAYDVAATVNPVYAVPTADGGLHPILPTNINSVPLSLYSVNLQTNPYVSSSPASVFPMPNVPSYYVVAGSCGAESAPDGGTTDGQPVTLTAGGQASPTINLVPVQIFVNQGGTLVSGATVTASVTNALGTGTDANCPSSGSTVMPTLQLSQTTGTWTNFARGKHRTHAIFVNNCNANCGTTTTVTSTLNPSTAGASVTLHATVACVQTCVSPSTPPPTGNVQFKDNGVALGAQVALVGGVASLTTAALSVATHPITAVYAGVAGKWNLSTSATLNQVVNPAPTATTLSSTPNPNGYGTSTLLTASVTCAASGCGTPTGTVTFKNGASNIAGCVAVALSSGSATCTLSGLNGGSYAVTAVYAPTTNYGASTSPVVTQQVTASSTTTALTSSSSPNSASGAALTFTATVTAATGGPPVGNVAFKDGATVLATVAVNGSGVATYTTSTLAVGTHSMSAVFTATNPSNFGTSTGTLVQGINAAFTLCGLPDGVWLLSATYSPNPITHLPFYSSAGEAVQVVIEVTPTGFYVASGGTFLGQPKLGPGTAVTVNVQ